MFTNFIKSIIVFALSGYIHDQGAYILLLHTHAPGKVIHWTDAIVFTPFFIVQPFGLAFEAAIKFVWRSWKARNFPGWIDIRLPDTQPSWLVFMERLIGFIWTWWWLGWTAGWFIQAAADIGLYTRLPNEKVWPSPFGGIFWGKWWF